MRVNLSLKYIISTSIVLSMILGILLYIISERHERLVITQTEMQAKALFQQIVITRRWVADHGGVFVEKLPWIKPNPYLENPLITDVAGKRYVKQNPALVTKQLSSYAQKEGLFFFNITSLKLLNPENAPDDFEKKALNDFESRESNESSKIEKIGSNYYFRYIAPLYVEKSCLHCHLKQDYKVGDIRGAISVSVPMDYAFGKIRAGRKHIIFGGIGTVVVLMVMLFILTKKTVIKPINRIRKSITDYSRTGLVDMPLLKTNDEIEDLSRSFIDMARAINEYHSCLQEKINSATKELVEKNEELIRVNMIKSDFIAKISHELRTPLTAINGAMDYLSIKLARKGAGAEDLSAFLDVIKKNAERLIRLVNNMLDYERINLGEFEMHFRDVNLRHVFSEVITGLLSEALKKNVMLKFDADDVTVCADEDRMKQVLTNLISNALNFSPESSDILISLKDNNGCAYVSVTDCGIGINEDEREMVFRQFYSKGVKNGTGLGLAICKGIIEAHNGEIGVRSEQNKGSCFYFMIPKKRGDICADEKTVACSR